VARTTWGFFPFKRIDPRAQTAMSERLAVTRRVPRPRFLRVDLGFSFLVPCALFRSVAKPHQWQSIPVHLSCSPTNCSAASPSDALVVCGSPGSRQFLHKESSRTLGPQQIQPPIATESHKMQISPPVIPFQSIRHRALLTPPQDLSSQPEGGAPSAYLYFSCRFRNGILPCGRPCQEKIKCPGPPVLTTVTRRIGRRIPR
jgi:hypothetical protein